VKGGDTVFAVRGAEVRGGDWFVPVSLAAELRREGLDALSKARSERGIGHRILPEGRAEYPAECLSAEENVTNRLAEAFYRDHGVGRIERGLDLAASTAGRRVMRSAYCIRREIGEFRTIGDPGYDNHAPARSFSDYKVEIDTANMPEGVSVIERI
jgi:putative protease